MGMYTHFVIDGVVKEEFRNIIKELYDINRNHHDILKEVMDFRLVVEKFNFKPFQDFAYRERTTLFFYGSQCEDDLEYDEQSGYWHLECEIKDYAECYEGKERTRTSECFIASMPDIFEEGATYSKQYEESDAPRKYILKDGKLIELN